MPGNCGLHRQNVDIHVYQNTVIRAIWSAFPSEIHVMMFCLLCSDISATHYESALLIDNDFNTYSNMDKFSFLMDNESIIRNSAKACHSILHRRRYVYIND